MAWLEQDPKSKNFKICFRFGSQRFKRSLGISNRKEAEVIAGGVKRNLLRIEQGLLEVPSRADLISFLLSDGRRSEKTVVSHVLTLEEFFRGYHDSLPTGSMESSSVATMQIHERHLIRHFGTRFVIQDLALSNLQGYVESRSNEKGIRGRPLSPTTIRKEITTFGSIWNWAVQMGHIEGEFPNRGLKYPKTAEKPPFQTWEEIEHIVSKNGMSACQARELWDCVFLQLGEIDELLQFVRNKARYPFVYPMFVFAAHTGARRSEIIRSQTTDFDFDGQTVLIREKKRVKGKQTMRRVPLSPLFGQVMKYWFANHPGGIHSICQDNSEKRQGLVTGLTRDEAHHHFKETLAGSKWEKIRGFHVLRHSFASNCAACGVDQRIINSWMGHQTEEMVNRYRHLVPNQQKEAIQLVFGG